MFCSPLQQNSWKELCILTVSNLSTPILSSALSKQAFTPRTHQKEFLSRPHYWVKWSVLLLTLVDSSMAFDTATWPLPTPGNCFLSWLPGTLHSCLSSYITGCSFSVLCSLLLLFLTLAHFLFLFSIHTPSLGDLIKYWNFKYHLHVKAPKFVSLSQALLQNPKLKNPTSFLTPPLGTSCSMFQTSVLDLSFQGSFAPGSPISVGSNPIFLLSQPKNLQVFTQTLHFHEAYFNNVIQNFMLWSPSHPHSPYFCYFVSIALTSF